MTINERIHNNNKKNIMKTNNYFVMAVLPSKGRGEVGQSQNDEHSSDYLNKGGPVLSQPFRTRSLC